jgi:hypothetical protein
MGSIVGKAGVVVTFDSQTENEIEEAGWHLGSISLNGEDVGTLPATKTLALGTYTIKFTGGDGLTFDYWDYDGGVDVEDWLSVETQLTVGGAGTVTAIYVLHNGVSDGDFEEYGLPNWDVEGGDEHGDMSGQYPFDAYHGSNSLYLAQNEGQFVHQTLGIQLSVSIIEDYTLYAKSPSPVLLSVDVVYSDDSETNINFGPLTEDWVEYNILPYLEAGKTVKTLRFNCSASSYILIDLVDLFYLGAP